MKEVTVVGIDLAKNVFQIHAVDSNHRTIICKTLRRTQLLRYFSNLKCCLIGMEACGSAHYWARELASLGHEVRLMPPQYVKPYVKSNKNDATDAEAICEAVTRPNMRFVGVKSAEQQALLLVHREREGVVKERTSLINRIRATLLEFGVAVPAGPARLHKWINEEYGLVDLPLLLMHHINRMINRLRGLETSLTELNDEISRQGKEHEACARLEEVPGIGRLTASALVATVGDCRSFKSGRQFSAWLGLVPRQHSSGGKQRLLGISKRGDSYIRRMLIHGARAVIKHMNPKRSVTPWLEQMMSRAHKNVVIVALANKLARIAWVLLSKGSRYKELAA